MSEVEVLRTGYRHFISRRDEGVLLIVNDSRLEEGMYDSQVNAKIVMYGVTVMTDEYTQTQGVTVMRVIHSAKGGGRLDMDRELYRMIFTALPVKKRQALIARAYVEGMEGILNYIAYQSARIQLFRSGVAFEQLIADSSRGTLALVESKGLQRQHVPTCLGGDWSYSEFDEWVRRRISIEDIMSAAPAVANKLLSPFITHTTRQKALIAKVGHQRLHQHHLNNKTARQNRKGADQAELSRLYARRSYHKKKLEVVGLREEVDALGLRKEELQQEQARLEQLLEAAKSMVSSTTNEQQQQLLPQSPELGTPLTGTDFQASPGPLQGTPAMPLLEPIPVSNAPGMNDLDLLEPIPVSAIPNNEDVLADLLEPNPVPDIMNHQIVSTKAQPTDPWSPMQGLFLMNGQPSVTLAMQQAPVELQDYPNNNQLVVKKPMQLGTTGLSQQQSARRSETNATWTYTTIPTTINSS